MTPTLEENGGLENAEEGKNTPTSGHSAVRTLRRKLLPETAIR
jgi:hypothetical protein